jgi:Na+/H+ antiporter NhaC
VGLLVLCALVFFVYFLGEHAGRESPSRTKQVQDIVKTEAELKNLKTNLYATTTPPWLSLLAVLFVIFLILKMFGLWHDDDDRHYHRRRH